MSCRLLLLSSSALLLAACIDDGGELSRRMTTTETSRQVYSATALKNYAYGNATGQGPTAWLNEGPNGLRGITCRADGEAVKGFYFAWFNQQTKDAGSLKGELVREVGGSVMGVVLDGRVVLSGKAIPASDCFDFSAYPNGWPVLVLPVHLPRPIETDDAKHEKRAERCPEGMAGAYTYSRTVSIKNGRSTYGSWQLDNPDGCQTVTKVDATIEDGTPKEYSQLGSTLDAALLPSLPTKCQRVTISASGADGDTKKVFDTCEFADLSGLEPIAEPPVGPRPLRPLPPPPPPCPPSAVTLPSMSSVAEYEAALAPIADAVRTMDAKCGVVRVTSEAWWPYYQTFNLNDTAALVRRYFVRVPMSWEATAGSRWTERHSTPYGYLSNFRLLPAAWRSHPQHWFKADVSEVNRVTTTMSMDGRSYVPFVGPNTAPALGPCAYCGGRAPLVYPNETGDPWGNNPDQHSYYVPFDYSSFSNQYHVEARGTF